MSERDSQPTASTSKEQGQCTERYPAPGPRSEPAGAVTYRCGLREGHQGPHGPIGSGAPEDFVPKTAAEVVTNIDHGFARMPIRSEGVHWLRAAEWDLIRPLLIRPAPETDGKLEGHGEPCAFCGKLCDRFAGNPGAWPIAFAHPDGTGIVKWHHVNCVVDRIQFPSETDCKHDQGHMRRFLGDGKYGPIECTNCGEPLKTSGEGA